MTAAVHLLSAIILTLSLAATPVHPARILAAFHMNSYSHWQMFRTLLRGLAARGHQVDVLGHMPQHPPIANYTDLSMEGLLPPMVENVDKHTLDFVSSPTIPPMWSFNFEMCKAVLDHAQVKRLLKSSVTYDLIITEIFAVDCLLPFAHKFNAPVVSILSSVLLPWANERMGNPEHPAYIPTYFSTFHREMTFTQRVKNVMNLIAAYQEANSFKESVDSLVRQHFGDDLPPMSELVKRTSLVLVNSHFSVNLPRPMVPGVVEVGGLHIAPTGKLPQELQTFLDEASHGVVYFSLGSMVRLDAITEEHIQMFVEAFSRMPQRVLWKVGSVEIPGLTSNVRTERWLSQIDVLSHPNVHAFISHGGLMSTQEAVYAGVPLVGMPLFADQFLNVRSIVDRGAAVLLDSETLTVDSILQTLHTVLDDPSYHDNAQQLSRKFRDRPQSPLDTAIFWTEYVIRHGGGNHLRSRALNLTWYQYLLLDVLAILLIALGAFVLVLWFACAKLSTLLRFSRATCDPHTLSPTKKRE